MMENTAKKDTKIYCQQGPDILQPISDGELSDKSFVFKDLFDVSGYVTGAGNPKWLETHQIAEDTSPLINRLLSGGATCLGRVQTDELAYSLNGQNIHYGTPKNPVASGCIPGGSSSGSAVTVAKQDVDFSIGTDTGGSVRVPASYCGLFGLRPTLGSLSLDHCFELSKSFDTAGIFTRDLALMQQVFDALSLKSEQVIDVDTLYLDPLLAGQLSDERASCLKNWCHRADISLENVDFLAENDLTLASLSLLFRTIQGYEIIQQHDDWLKQYGQSIAADIYQRVEWARTISEQQYWDAKAQQADFQKKLLNKMKSHNGLWLVPTTPSGPPSLQMPADNLAKYRTDLMGLTSIAGLAGLPQLHLPMDNLSEGPCGISLLGLANSERSLFATGLRLCKGDQ